MIHVRHSCNEFVSIDYLHINCNSFDTFIIERLSDTWVIVSGEENATLDSENICNEIMNGQEYVVTISCDYNNKSPPLRGRYVTIRRKDNPINRYIMNFCEVEVMSCPPGSWGYNSGNPADDCSRVCETCRDVPKTCRVSDGYCFTGCQDGFWGGNYCERQCDCPDGDPCDQTNGLCPGCDHITGCPTVGESYFHERVKYHSS